MVQNRSSSATKAGSRKPRTYYAYFLLAAFDVMTVMVSLYVNHEMTSIYKQSIEVNHEWAERLGSFVQLGQLAAEVNAPGNDVFDSGDVSRERERMRRADLGFQAHLKTIRKDLEERVPESEGRFLKGDLNEIELIMNLMKVEAGLIFDYLEKGLPAKAASRMATMDRRYAELGATVTRLGRRVQEIQRTHFHEQEATAAVLSRYEYFIAACIGLMVVSVAIYGQRLSRRLSEQARETEKHVQALEQSEKDLRKAKEAAEFASQAKSTFLANMSHELRTPLNAIIGYAELLQEERNDPVQVGRDLQRIQIAARHLLGLISDILDVAKIEAGKIELMREIVDVPGLVREVESTILPAAAKNHNELCVSVSDSVGRMRADSLKLRQMLLNVLSNACKFTKDGRISLDVDIYEQDGQAWILFTVSDTGIGIAKDHLDRLFEPFFQGDSTIRKRFGGAGLGLALTKSFCEIMGGKISVESELGKGTRCQIHLPVFSKSIPPVQMLEA